MKDEKEVLVGIIRPDGGPLKEEDAEIIFDALLRKLIDMNYGLINNSLGCADNTDKFQIIVGNKDISFREFYEKSHQQEA